MIREAGRLLAIAGIATAMAIAARAQVPEQLVGGDHEHSQHNFLAHPNYGYRGLLTALGRFPWGRASNQESSPKKNLTCSLNPELMEKS
jgi:hypothetical protein